MAVLHTGCARKEGSSDVADPGNAANFENAADPEGTAEPEDMADPEGTADTENEPHFESTPEPEVYVEKSVLKTGKKVYSDNRYTITALGLKEYGKIKSDEYTDKPAAGKKYLVFFLEVQNSTEEKLYFHPDYLSAKVDGKKISHTFLYHSPEGYKTIFQNIDAGDFKKGFIVWEVPKDWKKMVITFTEFEILGGKRLVLTATRKNLKEPEEPIIRAESNS